MGYEPEVPPIPTRIDEIKYIEKLAENFRDQPYYKYYSPEALRQNKMDLAERINQYNRDWYGNFFFGRIA